MNGQSGKIHPRVIATTDRLLLRELAPGDARFILGLLNEPSFLRFVGDKGVRTEEDAARYIEEGPRASYRRNGFGLYLVLGRDSGEPMGICGLMNREWLDAPDLGFSLVPPYWGRGYAREAAVAVLAEAASAYGHARILAITDPGNADSMGLLARLGFSFWKPVTTPRGEVLSLWSNVREPPEAAAP